MKSDLILKWGKYKGRTIDSIPSDYLKWLAENVEDEDVACAADEEYRWREDNNEHFWD